MRHRATLDETAIPASGRWLDGALKSLSIAGLIALVFLGGATASYFKAFPYGELDQAWTAARAWRGLLRGEKPATFGRFIPAAVASPSGPAADQPRPGADEPILIGGGPSENLPVCPTYGCLAWIVDRRGGILHKWEVDFQPIVDQMSGYDGQLTPAMLRPHDWHLESNGDLTVIFVNDAAFPTGGSVVRFDWNGRLLWALNNGAHHWMSIDRDGTMYMPINRRAPTPLPFGDGRLAFKCSEGAVLLDYIQVVDRMGRPRETIDLMEVLLRAGLEGLLMSTYSHCDPLHLNFVQVVESQTASVAGLDPGDLIVSLRNISTVAVLGAAGRGVKWLTSGHTGRQHSPRIADDGSLMISDNFGGRHAGGGSRIARMTIGSDEVTTLFPVDQEPSGLDFFTGVGGLIQIRPGTSRVLVALTRPGRIMEIDLGQGTVLWDYTKQFPSDGYPGASSSRPAQRFVQVRAFGGYYVLDPEVLARLGRAAGRRDASR